MSVFIICTKIELAYAILVLGRVYYYWLKLEDVVLIINWFFKKRKMRYLKQRCGTFAYKQNTFPKNVFVSKMFFFFTNCYIEITLLEYYIKIFKITAKIPRPGFLSLQNNFDLLCWICVCNILQLSKKAASQKISKIYMCFDFELIYWTFLTLIWKNKASKVKREKIQEIMIS